MKMGTGHHGMLLGVLGPCVNGGRGDKRSPPTPHHLVCMRAVAAMGSAAKLQPGMIMTQLPQYAG